MNALWGVHAHFRYHFVEPTTLLLQNLRFFTVPSLIETRLGGDIRTSARNSVVCLFCLYYCVFTFLNINKENTLYGSFAHQYFETWWMTSPKTNAQSCVFV